MYPLQNFYEDVNKMKPEQKPLVQTNFEYFDKTVFKRMMANPGVMNDHDLSMFIKNNLEFICTDILSGDKSYVNAFVDRRFLHLFIRVISSIPIDQNLKIACNKITYDYFTSDNPDSSIKQLHLNMSRIVNRQEINKLVSIGLDETTACNLALCRYSSSNEKTNSKRLNFAIYHRDPEVMTEQMVVWIYEQLYTNISDLFQAIMFEWYTPQQQDDFGDNFMEVFGTVGNAMLIILNNMTSDKIRKVLIGYNAQWETTGRPQVRFSLHALSSDYSRITNSINQISREEGRIIP